MVNNLFDKNLILKNHKNIGNGIGGLRNITGHGVDKDTQEEWEIAKQFSARIAYKGVMREWQTVIMIKTREMAHLF